jgi:hypothetical protein
MYGEVKIQVSLNINSVINSGYIYLRFGKEGGNEGSL